VKKVLLFFFVMISISLAQEKKNTFAISGDEFLLNSKPFQIISGEMHPARIPKEYWRHRIQMAKAMGCNTIASYIFWNYHETSPGVFDFSTDNKNISEFVKIAQQEGMWVLFRPGPYVCAEWDFGGLPPYLLAIPDIKVRCMDSRYMEAAERYVTKIAQLIKPLLVTNGGPILMVQVENEYGSYGNDKNYLEALRNIWLKNGIDVPFYTSDGPTDYMLEAGNIDGCVIGLDSGVNQANFDTAKKRNSNVPAFSSETYPGWLTHWGETWARPDTAELLKDLKFLLENKKSFNLYVIHGGTNFGFTAGANSGRKGYEPDLTSYDYDAPINEQGAPTPKYYALRNLISKYVKNIPEIPAPIKAIEISNIKMELAGSIWNNLPNAKLSVQPKPMEMFEQYQGLILYRTKLIGHKSGKLIINDLHDYATVFLNGKFIGTIDRRLGENSIELPQTNEQNPMLEILVEEMGRINFGPCIIDRKGITDLVTLNSMTLMNWEVFNLSFDNEYISKLKFAQPEQEKRGYFFKGSFEINEVGDTYIDMNQFKKGLLFINGNNLGRYWRIGPQKRLYCPTTFLKKGKNEILIFDMLQTESANVSGKLTLE
jgi:beta-galactosidase